MPEHEDEPRPIPITGEWYVGDLSELLAQPPEVPIPPQPPAPRFPAPAVPGVAPPPLPEPEPLFVEPQYGPPPEQAVDPVLVDGLAIRETWRSRIRTTPFGDWSAATLLQATASMRYSPQPNFAFWDEAPLRVTLARLPEASLNPVADPVPLLSRLRMLHERLLVGGVRYPISAEWSELGGTPAVLDRLAKTPSGPTAGFFLAAEVRPDLGLVAYGYTPPSREEALVQVGIPLAASGRLDSDALVWSGLSGWTRSERVLLTTDALEATARLEPLPSGWGLEEWRQSLYDEAPFLRDLQTLGARDVVVPGLDAARLDRFDWQPSGRGRLLTTVVAGVSGTNGFSFVFEVPLEGDGELTVTDPDEVLSMVAVEPTGAAGSIG